MEMEFKDNSRRRTLVLVVGVLLALGAGAAAFMLSSQGQDEPETVLPTRDVVVAADFIPARETIGLDMLTTRTLQLDASNESAVTDPAEIAGSVAAISILPAQPITKNMLAQAQTAGSLDILEPDEARIVAPHDEIAEILYVCDVGGRGQVSQHIGALYLSGRGKKVVGIQYGGDLGR